MKPEYQQTRFLVPKLDHMPARFGILTGCNPDGVTFSDDQNKSTTERLRSALASAGFHFFAVTGCSPDLRHREPGFGIVTDDREIIVELGRTWKQDAIFWVEHGTVHLVSCSDCEAVALGRWCDLLHQD